ncbi:TetR family transcriptional regulator [Nocardioides currus]|uniref:TetR/AcrR family transcriptional regulator n=1 Tax=Nocardioides currus TaxID=2133958 RepID=A0A2R7Z1V6_9ACTN|nr:TetR family transcriptional regulator [Nocardioides currus]PUA82605.1 TetR/AcrR family transcriptional regulator [Nocardioides currus]
MPRDATQTRAAILAAATAEFAQFGLAGARVDRIAAGAGCNKQLIYAHFGSKQGLFDEVAVTHVRRLLDSVPITAEDLPGYAVRLFEHIAAHPDLVRLTMWQQLEGGGLAALADLEAESTAAKVKAVRAAQRAGHVTKALPAAHLVTLVIGVTISWLLEGDGSDPRKSIRTAVERLVAV